MDAECEKNGTNSAFAAVDKLTLRAFDELVWSAAFGEPWCTKVRSK